MIGSRLGPYEITAKLGAGGMGEVYRATDSKLRRDVAIKVLPAAFTADPERLARFDREAQLLAQLHHPHIASIFGLEQSDGVRALVMELVEGPTLAEKIGRGALPVDEAVAIAKQIAEALEAAHEKGIVHRDLKPANVKIAPDGTVKVLDFGLAKALDPVASSSSPSASPTLMHSPTLTAAGTQLGVILGTAAYMAPEQAKGAAVDKRADIWAFGVVLYEMLAGGLLFAGDSVAETLAGVLKSEIDFGRLPPETPVALRQLLRRCLERNPKNRLHDIADARLVLDDVIGGRETSSAATPAAPPRRLAALVPWLVAALSLVAAVVVWWSARDAPPAASAGSYELALAAPAGAEFVFASNTGWGVVSPDGRQVVFPASAEGRRALWIRSLGRADARELPGTDRGFYPFWSPDSRSIAFFGAGALKKMEVAGGLPERICDALHGRGGSWGESGWIVFTPLGGGAISRVRAEGGEPVALTAVDATAGEDAHYWPTWLPGNQSFLYFIRSGRRENQGVYLGKVVEGGIDRERRRLVASSASGIFAPAAAGREAMLLWAQEDRLLARAFDTGRGTLTGVVSEVARGVRVLGSQRSTMASVSTTGTLVFASSEVGQFRLEAFDRQGRPLGPLPIPRGDFHQLVASPDGRRLAYVSVREGQGDIWVHDLATGTNRPLTSSAEYDEVPSWSPDGKELLFRSGAMAPEAMRRLGVDGEMAPRRLALGSEALGSGMMSIGAWLSDEWGIGVIRNADGSNGFAAIGLRDGSRFEPLPGAVDVGPRDPNYSPSAGAIAYTSAATGSSEGFVVSVEVGRGGVRLGSDRQRLPVEGARSIRWRQDGGELYAVAADGALWAIPVTRKDGALRLGAAEKLFAGAFIDGDFEAAGNGDRFFFRVDPAAAHQTLSVVLDWPARIAGAQP